MKTLIDMDNEWVNIKGFEGKYQINKDGIVINVVKGRILKPEMNSKGYKRIAIAFAKGKRARFFVHRLVAESFIPNPDGKLVVNHIDGNPLNNSISNLEWCTHSENKLHAFRIGLQSARGEKQAKRKLNNQKVYEIRERLAKGEHPAMIATFFGVTQSVIYNIRSRRYWSHI